MEEGGMRGYSVMEAAALDLFIFLFFYEQKQFSHKSASMGK